MMRVIKTFRINRERGDTEKWASDPGGRRGGGEGGGVQVAECGEGLLDCYTAPPLKKKFVSCPAGGRNCGQSGCRKFFFLLLFLFLL